MAAAAADTIRVLHAFEPVATAVSRSPTLDGQVPLRVAQACVPFLEGNAAGVQIVFSRRITVRVRLGRASIAMDEAGRHVDRVHRALVPFYVERGLLPRGGEWHRRLSRGPFWTERGVLRVWTGLLVTPPRDGFVRVSDGGNRRARGFGVRRAHLAGGAPVPLVVDLQGVRDGARLEGEVATLFPVEHRRIEVVPLDEARALVEAHADFYDARYFSKKSDATTKKYRRLVAEEAARPERREAHVRVAHLAGPRPEIVDTSRILTGEGERRGAAPPAVRFASPVSVRAQWDGHTFVVTPDPRELDEGAREVRRALAGAMGEAWVSQHKGAVLYLTKYVTPHPIGEPHFFVKPWAFVETPRGVSFVVEAAEGFDATPLEVLRGAVWGDRFHAVPAVFHATGSTVAKLARGAPLVDVFPVTREALTRPAVVEEIT